MCPMVLERDQIQMNYEKSYMVSEKKSDTFRNVLGCVRNMSGGIG